MTRLIICPICRGDGRTQQTDIDWDTCIKCNGTGSISINSEPVDMYNLCPHCSFNWDGGDVLEQLKNLSLHVTKSDNELIKLASNYGWYPDSPKRLTNLIIVKIEANIARTRTDLYVQEAIGHEPRVEEILYNNTYVECPQCRHVWNKDTGEHYNNINELKQLI